VCSGKGRGSRILIPLIVDEDYHWVELTQVGWIASCYQISKGTGGDTNLGPKRLNHHLFLKPLRLSWQNKKQLMSVVGGTVRYADILTEIMNKCKLQASDPRFKKNPELALVVLHRFLFSSSLNGCYTKYKVSHAARSDRSRAGNNLQVHPVPVTLI